MLTLIKRYCEDLEIKVAFSSFNIKDLMNVKDSVPRTLRSIGVIFYMNIILKNSTILVNTVEIVPVRSTATEATIFLMLLLWEWSGLPYLVAVSTKQTPSGCI